MNRNSYIASMVVAGLSFSGLVSVTKAAGGAESWVNEANKSVAIASTAVEEARTAIENAKSLVSMVPADSDLMDEIKEMLMAASENWALAVDALDGAKESASKIRSASSSELAQDYKLLATVNAGVALSGAKVVQTGILFVDAAAHNKVEVLDVIRVAMQDSLASASQVQFNYERVKSLITEKYSN